MNITKSKEFPYLEIREQILSRYKNIGNCKLRDGLGGHNYVELLNGKWDTRNRDFYFCIHITPSNNYLWSTLYAIVEGFIFVYCFETYNEYSEPKEYMSVEFFGKDYRYNLEAVYRINKETLDKLNILGGKDRLTPYSIFNLLHTDKVTKVNLDRG